MSTVTPIKTYPLEAVFPDAKHYDKLRVAWSDAVKAGVDPEDLAHHLTAMACETLRLAEYANSLITVTVAREARKYVANHLPTPLTDDERRILAALKSAPMTTREIYERCDLSEAGARKICLRLQGYGYVQRAEQDWQRRYTPRMWRITEQGRKA